METDFIPPYNSCYSNPKEEWEEEENVSKPKFQHQSEVSLFPLLSFVSSISFPLSSSISSCFLHLNNNVYNIQKELLFWLVLRDCFSINREAEVTVLN